MKFNHLLTSLSVRFGNTGWTPGRPSIISTVLTGWYRPADQKWPATPLNITGADIGLWYNRNAKEPPFFAQAELLSCSSCAPYPQAITRFLCPHSNTLQITHCPPTAASGPSLQADSLTGLGNSPETKVQVYICTRHRSISFKNKLKVYIEPC